MGKTIRNDADNVVESRDRKRNGFRQDRNAARIAKDMARGKWVPKGTARRANREA